MNLTITVEVTAGVDFRDAVKEGKELSKKLGCFIEFRFNGITVFCGPDAEPDLALEEYCRLLRSDQKLKFMRA